MYRLRSVLLGLADPLQQRVSARVADAMSDGHAEDVTLISELYAEGWTAARKGGVARSR